QVDGLGVGGRQCRRRVAKLVTPVGAGAPGRALQDEARAARCRDARIAGEIGTQRPRALLILQQMERREVRQLETIVEDQICLDAAVCKEQAAIKLGEAVSKSWHSGDPFTLRPHSIWTAHFSHYRPTPVAIPQALRPHSSSLRDICVRLDPKLP